ncbi:MAG: hypothetical protein ACPG19_13195 [Saprospiraceae bacterium]
MLNFKIMNSKTSKSLPTLNDRVIMYLDSELTKQEERNLLLEIQSNPQLKEFFNKEKSFREFIRNKVNRQKVSPALVQNIKDRIRQRAMS